MATEPVSATLRWSMVAIALTVTASAFSFINAVPFMIPALEAARGTALAEAGLLSAMPSLGMVVTLVAWGYVADRIGERTVLATGAALTAVSAFAAASVNSLVAMGALLFLGGMAAASCNPACGRLVAGWFPAHQRGLAMGVRQTAQPLGIAMGALVIPRLAEHRPSLGLLFPASACAVSAGVGAMIAHDPPRKSRTAAAEAELVNPYRGSAVLWRIHAISALMVMPQSMTVTFMLVWLTGNHGWSVRAAGALVTITQLFGALTRIAAGRWSDCVGSRMRPVRIVALATSVTLLMLSLANQLDSPLAVAFMVLVSVITVMDNGLEATAITEFAGQFWSGRALGVQNTAQRLMTLAGPPAFGAMITVGGYPLAFALCGLFPLAAAPLVPVGVLPPCAEDRPAAYPVGQLHRKPVRARR
ncbi:MFS transporter [Mycobacterium kansasii]|uniref:MFS transporter n=1 Tax=Mycobacterium kansasii TaxID=1768 RepID=UPI0009EF73B2|nr:MFS transporter [Mycobacterium kansasii]ARG55405.1 MFS transporter [Mycobacterium kansasii]